MGQQDVASCVPWCWASYLLVEGLSNNMLGHVLDFREMEKLSVSVSSFGP